MINNLCMTRLFLIFTLLLLLLKRMQLVTEIVFVNCAMEYCTNHTDAILRHDREKLQI